MSGSLPALIHSLAAAGDIGELRLRFMDAAGEAFGASAWGFYLLDERLRPDVIDVRGLPDSFVLRYEEVGRDLDPVMAYVGRRHVPAHELLMETEAQWHGSGLYRHVSSRYGLEHIMTGPLVGGGRLVGTLNFGRPARSLPFGAGDLQRLSALCAHVTAALAARRPAPTWRDAPAAARLTRRELEIADLVALGWSNRRIAAHLTVSDETVKEALRRVYRKLEVGTRAAMVARLRERG